MGKTRRRTRTRTRTQQRGGDWGLSNWGPSNWGLPNLGDKVKNVLPSGWGFGSSTTPQYTYTQPQSQDTQPIVQSSNDLQLSTMPNESVNNAYPTTETKTETVTGGKRHKTMKRIKGGKGGLGLVYYASPVSGLRVAEPTYMIPYNNVKMGGKRRSSGHKRRSKKNKSRNKKH
jgi:hypothetical protein